MLEWTWRYGEGAKRSDTGRMSSRHCRFWQPITSFCWWTSQRRHLPTAFQTACIPLGLEDVSWQKICLSVDSTPSNVPKPAAAVGGIRVSALFAGLEFAGLFYLMRFPDKSPGYTLHRSGRSKSVRRRGIGLASGSIYPQNMRLIPPPPLSRHKEKWS